jgi:hypothetical protein
VTVPLPNFTPKDWQNDAAGGTPITEAELDLRDNTIAQLIAYVDQLGDTVAAVQATVGNTGQQIVNENLVTSTNRGAPTAGRRVYDLGLLKPIWGMARTGGTPPGRSSRGQDHRTRRRTWSRS